MEISADFKGNLDNGKFGCVIFTGLKKAFNTVNDQILLIKLKHYGIRGVMLIWVES